MIMTNSFEVSQLINDLLKEITSSEETKGVDLSTTTGDYKYYGVRVPVIRSLAKSYWNELKKYQQTSVDQLMEICTQLLHQKVAELRTIAFQWSFRVKSKYVPNHFEVFESWLTKYVTSWGSCDDLCTHSLGYFIFQYPEYIVQLKEWARSDNIWVRRGAAVSLIYGLRRGEFLAEAFELADILLEDDEMYVQKGYGWMLKEASNTYQQEVFDYVMDKKEKMPRTSLRYAIEKMPDKLRKKAMN